MAGEGFPSNPPLTPAQINAQLTIYGLTLPDNKLSITGSSDATKIARFEVDGLTTATTRTFTVPDANIIIAGSASALTSGRIPFGTTGGLLLDSASLTWDTATTTLSVGTAQTTYLAGFTGSGNNATSGSIKIKNSNNGTASAAEVIVESATSSGFIGAFPSNYTGTAAYADSLVFATNSDATALIIAAQSSGQEIRFRTNSAQRAAFGTEGGLTLAAGTQTTDIKALDSSVTWNAAVTFTGWKLNVTDTSSNSGSLLLDLQVASSSKFNIDKSGNVIVSGALTTGNHTFTDGSNIVINTTTGTKIGTGTTQKIGFYNATPVVQPTDGATFTNNVTSGGTTNQCDDFTSLTVYATDAAAIRNNIYQLARKVKIICDNLRSLGLAS